MLEIEATVIATGGTPKCSVYEIISRLHPARYLSVPDEAVYALVADEDISPSEAIGVYVGVLREANRFHRCDWRGQVYAYDLLAKDIEGYDGPDLVIESLRYGNECRFINDVHTRQGGLRTVNAEAFAVWDSKRQLPVVLIFASRHIYKHEEIIVDYGKHFWKKVTPTLTKEQGAYLQEKLQLRDMMINTLSKYGGRIPTEKLNTNMDDNESNLFKFFEKVDDNESNLYDKLKSAKRNLFKNKDQIKYKPQFCNSIDFLEGTDPQPVIYLALEEGTEEQPSYLINEIKRLGWVYTNDVKETTHLVTDVVQRSYIFLAALSICQYVLEISWLKDSIEKGYNPGEKHFRLEDKSFNSLGFNPLRKERKPGLLAMYDVYCTSNISNLKDFITMVGCAGGRMSQKPHKYRPYLLIITNDIDQQYHAQLRHMGFALYSPDLIKDSILCETLNMNKKYRL